MKKLALAAALIVGLSAPFAAEACNATGYLITLIVPGNFPTGAATLFVRHPTSSGIITSARTTNLGVVSAASAAVAGGEQRVLMITNGGGAGVCAAGATGTVATLALRP